MVDSVKIKYVPVLKWRKGEKVALKELAEQLKGSIIPLIELVNDEGDNPDDLSKDLANYWRLPAYVDVYYRPNHFARTALDSLARNHSQGIDVIPVIRLDSPSIIIEGIKEVAGMYGNGIAVRISLNEEQDYGMLKEEIGLILGQLRTPNDKRDLIVDFGYIKEPKSYEVTLGQIAKIITPNDWRRVIISGGIFPISLNEFKPNADNFLVRTEWELWLKHKNILGTNVIFSDYTVRSPQSVTKGGFGSISVRYTLKDQYQIFRGTLSDKPFKFLVHASNIKALYGLDYKDTYSWGDRVIREKATQLERALEAGYDPETYTGFKPGSKTEWVAASINHHISLVLKENL